MIEPPHPPLVVDRVRHVGDQVAVVIAETLAQAREAAELIQVDYAEEPAAIDPAEALDRGAPQVWPEAPGNLCYDWHLGDLAAVEAAFAKAARIVKLDLTNNRLVPNAMEPRAAIGEFNRATGEYTLYTTSQNPHVIRLLMGAFVLHIPEAQAAGRRPRCRRRVRVEDLSLRRGGDRYLGRRQDEAAGQVDGRAFGKLYVGRAWARPCHPCRARARRSRPSFSASGFRRSPIWAPICRPLRPVSRPTSTAPCWPAPIRPRRSTSRPRRCLPTRCRSTLIAERAARKRLSCSSASSISRPTSSGWTRPSCAGAISSQRTPTLPDPGGAAIRQRRLWTTLELALKAADYQGFERGAGRRRRAGKLRGIGVATYIEACGIAPSAVVGSLGARAGLFECASVRVHPTGSVTVLTGSHSHGQGHETTFAQLVSDGLGIPIESVEIVHGDSAKIPYGMGTYGSRSLAVGGTAIVKAMDKVVAKGRKIAAHLLEAAEADVEFKDGKFTVAGTDRSKTLAEVALTAYVPHNFPHDELEPGLDETAFYDPKNFTFPSGAHIAEVEIDPETGEVHGRQFHRQRRFRPHPQPDDRRGPGPWRPGPGHRPGIARRLRLRQGNRASC